MRNTSFLMLMLALLLAACQTTRDTRQPMMMPASEHKACDDSFEFIVAQLNDVYEISPLDRGRIGGMARVATVLRHLEEKNPHTIAILSGDFLSPSLISSLDKVVGNDTIPIAGEQMVAAMNAVGIDYVTFGNHEFDKKDPAVLQSRLNESHFDYVSGNVLQRIDSVTTTPFTQIRGGLATPVPEFIVHTFGTPSCGQARLGLIGLTLDFNKQDYVHYEDVIREGTRTFEAARAESDVVFAITHLAFSTDSTLARTIPALPLIMGGHEHEDTLAVVGNTRIAKADANARTIYIHWVRYHPRTGDVDIWSQLMPITEDIKEDPGVQSLVQLWDGTANAAIRAMGYDPMDVVAQLKKPYDGHEASIRKKPTNLGRAVACAMLSEDSAASFAFLNSGSIRIDDMLAGEVTQRDVLRVLPFGGEVVHGSFRGDVLKRILDIGLHKNRGEGGYLQTTPNVKDSGGGKYAIDGQDLQANRIYEAVLPAFLSEGDEKNLEFMATSGQYQPLDLTGIDGSPKNDLRDVTMKYLESKTDNWEVCPP